MAAQARALVVRGARAALVKGGHLDGEPMDVLFANGAAGFCSRDGASTRATRTAPAARWPRPSPRISPRDRRLARRSREAKAWLEQALAAGEALQLGAGSGPPNHFWELWGKP